MANSTVPDQTAPIGAIYSGSTLFASKLNLSAMLGNYLQQTTSADNIFRCIFFLALKGLIDIFVNLFQDLKPSNIAVNEDCELKVTLLIFTGVHAIDI